MGHSKFEIFLFNNLKNRMLADFYIPRLSNDRKIAVQKNYLGVTFCTKMNFINFSWNFDFLKNFSTSIEISIKLSFLTKLFFRKFSSDTLMMKNNNFEF